MAQDYKTPGTYYVVYLPMSGPVEVKLAEVVLTEEDVAQYMSVSTKFWGSRPGPAVVKRIYRADLLDGAGKQ